jgi:hypothetical protein
MRTPLGSGVNSTCAMRSPNEYSISLCSRHRTGRKHQPRAACHGGTSVVSGQNGPRVHRLRQSQCWQNQHGLRRERIHATCGRRAVQDDGRRQLNSRAYRSAGPALTDLLGGQVQVMFDNMASSIEHIRAGKLRPLAVTTTMRSETLPDVPTVSEFVPGYEVSNWFGVGAPKATPAEIPRQAQQGDQR